MIAQPRLTIVINEWLLSPTLTNEFVVIDQLSQLHRLRGLARTV